MYIRHKYIFSRSMICVSIKIFSKQRNACSWWKHMHRAGLSVRRPPNASSQKEHQNFSITYIHCIKFLICNVQKKLGKRDMRHHFWSSSSAPTQIPRSGRTRPLFRHSKTYVVIKIMQNYSVRNKIYMASTSWSSIRQSFSYN